MIEYFPDQREDAIEHARSEWPNESCGAIIDDEYVPYRNSADDTSNTFLIEDAEFTKAYIQGRVQAVIHSHNDYNMASVQDQRQQMAMDVPFGIINMVNKSVVNFIYFGDDLETQDLIGRPFFFGAYDCYSLVRDWYKVNWGVITPNVAIDFAFWNRNESKFEEAIEKDGRFMFVDINKTITGDSLLYNFHGTKYINHTGVRQESGLILHHFYGQVSAEYPISYSRDHLIRACRLNPDWREND